MNALVLIFINFATAPFFYEVEEFIKEPAPKRNMSSIVLLKKARGQRWLKFYAVFLLILMALFSFPTRSGEKYEASAGLIVSVVIVQAALWLYVFRCYLLKGKK